MPASIATRAASPRRPRVARSPRPRPGEPLPSDRPAPAARDSDRRPGAGRSAGRSPPPAGRPAACRRSSGAAPCSFGRFKPLAPTSVIIDDPIEEADRALDTDPGVAEPLAQVLQRAPGLGVLPARRSRAPFPGSQPSRPARSPRRSTASGRESCWCSDRGQSTKPWARGSAVAEAGAAPARPQAATPPAKQCAL